MTSITTAVDRLIDALRDHGSIVKETGQDRAVAQCPAHDDSRPSLSISARRDGKGAVVFCHAGCEYIAVLDALGLAARDLFDDPRMRAAYNDRTTYVYPDGRKVHRKPDKTFPQSGNTKGRSLYHADLIGDADTVHVPEGEKDVQAIEAAGGIAVCSAMGAGKARFADWTPLAGKQVIIVADNDEPGLKHARQVGELLDGIEASVRIVKAAVGKDAADHLAADRTLGEFVPVDDGDVHPDLDDAHIGPYIAEHYLAGDYLHSKAFGWMQFDGRRWETIDDGIVAEVIRQAVIDLHRIEARAGADADRLMKISRMFTANRLRSVLWVARNYLTRRGEEFDAHPELLNVHNGVVDLRDGTLHPHDPKLLFTNATMVAYRPGATHADWDRALTAVSSDEADWLQIRFGQGLTGHPPSDDVLVVLKGSGENGKTTVIDGVRGAAGVEYAIPLPDRVLLARTGDHPTELMTLRDARLAFMEEFPELGHLNVKRLKDLTGTEWMSARLCGKDTVNWKATHSVFVTTNYRPRVDESDHGTWRRLALVEFPHRYRKPHEAIEAQSDLPADPGLRDRVRRGEDGQHEAVLAWLIAGAVRWYQNGRTMPEPPASVLEATLAWRKSVDLLLRFYDDRLVFDAEAHVISKELYEDFTDWLKDHGHAGWTDQNFTARFGQHPEVTAHGVQKKLIRSTAPQTLSRRPRPSWHTGSEPAPERYRAWLGVRFRTPADD
jgi:putative DNA primase/helicase